MIKDYNSRKMTGANVEYVVVRDVPYVVFMRVGNGEVVEIMSMGAVSIEDVGG